MRTLGPDRRPAAKRLDPRACALCRAARAQVEAELREARRAAGAQAAEQRRAALAAAAEARRLSEVARFGGGLRTEDGRAWEPYDGVLWMDGPAGRARVRLRAVGAPPW